jgi:lipopolysaccharide transport system ATP-binding protein
MSAIITVDNLGKQYALRGTGPPAYATLRDSLADAVSWLFSRAPLSEQKQSARSFWALRNVSFDVAEGEIVGIVGRNGAGKSTLLKVLSRITAPSEGEARIRGRLGSLLEVGTGFHPELSGRENIYFNGAILGLRKNEIRHRFDEIVDFSAVGDFLDIPIKRYSSGMRMRLAFSVAAHLEPEIMIVDEVLAVGDADFQRKCLGKMKDVANSGRTVLFVSHNINAVMQLCSRVLWLERGAVREDTLAVQEVCGRYLLGSGGALKGAYIAAEDGALDTEYFSLYSFRVADAKGNTLDQPTPNDRPVTVEIEVDIHRLSPLLNFGFAVIDQQGQQVFWSVTTDRAEYEWPKLSMRRNKLYAEIPIRLLNEGKYRIDFFASLHGQGWFSEPGSTSVSVQLQIAGGLSPSPYWTSRRPGSVAPVLTWHAGSSRELA